MKGKLYVAKKYSEKKGKSYITTILDLNGNEIMINIDKYYMCLIAGLEPRLLESTEVGYKSSPIEFEF